MKIRMAKSENRKGKGQAKAGNREIHQIRERVAESSKQLNRQDACPTTRARLVAILEEYGVSVHGFDGLRSDAYEKHVASRSLEELEGLYRTLLAPSGSYEEKQKLCPVWKKGGKGEDKLPDITTLSRIKERIMSDFSVREKVRSRGFLAAREQEGGERVEDTQYIRAATEIIGEELLGAKMEGTPMLENLKGFDRLLKAGSLRVREQRETRGNARFEWERFGKEIEQKPKPPSAGSELVRLSAAELEVLYSIRVRCIQEKVYGPFPEEYRQRDVKEMVDQIKVSVAEDPANGLVVEGPGKKGEIPQPGGIPKTKPVTGQHDAGFQQTEESPKSNAQGLEPVNDAKANDEARMTNGETGVQDLAAGHQVSSVQSETNGTPGTRPSDQRDVGPTDGKNGTDRTDKTNQEVQPEMVAAPVDMVSEAQRRRREQELAVQRAQRMRAAWAQDERLKYG